MQVPCDGGDYGAGVGGHVGAVAAHPLRVGRYGFAGGYYGGFGGGGWEVIVGHFFVGVFAFEVLRSDWGGGWEDGDRHAGRGSALWGLGVGCRGRDGSKEDMESFSGL